MIMVINILLISVTFSERFMPFQNNLFNFVLHRMNDNVDHVFVFFFLSSSSCIPHCVHYVFNNLVPDWIFVTRHLLWLLSSSLLLLLFLLLFYFFNCVWRQLFFYYIFLVIIHPWKNPDWHGSKLNARVIRFYCCLEMTLNPYDFFEKFLFVFACLWKPSFVHPWHDVLSNCRVEMMHDLF